MTFDVKSLELATHFLSDLKDYQLPTPRNEAENKLAEVIQGAIEDWIFANTIPF